jgi:hypothetical protein
VEWRGLIVAADFSCNLLGVRNSAWNDDPTLIATINDDVEEQNLSTLAIRNAVSSLLPASHYITYSLANEACCGEGQESFCCTRSRPQSQNLVLR